MNAFNNLTEQPTYERLLFDVNTISRRVMNLEADHVPRIDFQQLNDGV